MVIADIWGSSYLHHVRVLYPLREFSADSQDLSKETTLHLYQESPTSQDNQLAPTIQPAQWELHK